LSDELKLAINQGHESISKETIRTGRRVKVREKNFKIEKTCHPSFRRRRGRGNPIKEAASDEGEAWCD